MRESPTFALLDLLKARDASLAYYDPYIPVIAKTREHGAWEGMRSVPWDEETVKDFDAAIVVTAHRSVDYRQLHDWCECIVDTRNVLPRAGSKKVWSA